MPDWQALVRRQLDGLALEPRERAEVIEELASHLVETFEGLRRQGFTEEDAARQCMTEVKDWHDLRRRIQSARRKEDIMTNRIRQFWIPGLLTFVLAMSFLALLQKFGPKPWVVALRGVLPVATLYIPWLLSLPLIGATGAYLSHRTGGSQRAVFSSIVFPVLPYLLLFLVGFPVALIVDDHVAHNIMPSAFIVGLFAWVLLPAVALLAGGLPVQLFVSRRLNSRRIVGN